MNMAPPREKLGDGLISGSRSARNWSATGLILERGAEDPQSFGVYLDRGTGREEQLFELQPVS
jgi:hypothetical protein